MARTILLMGWIMLIRASARAPGPCGGLLAAAFFATLIWLVLHYGIVPINSITAVTWLILVALARVPAAGMPCAPTLVVGPPVSSMWATSRHNPNHYPVRWSEHHRALA